VRSWHHLAALDVGLGTAADENAHDQNSCCNVAGSSSSFGPQLNPALVKLAQSTEASIKSRKVKPVSGKLKDLSGAKRRFP
jgi:hypothetical protein